MGNPAAAFLRGFATMDQLETNRLNRRLQGEKMSRLRTMWERQDEVYEREELDRYRAKKAAEFSLITDEIMQERSDEIDAAEAAGDMETADRIRNEWFTGGKESRARLVNEGWKRQLQRDPSVGELFALANGQDAAAGPFVRDKTKPVSGFGIAPPSSPFAGRLFAEIDSVNGLQPMTDGRSARADDKVWTAAPTLSSLYAMYGSPELIKQHQIFGMIMQDLGATEATGQMESQDTRQRTPDSDPVTESTTESGGSEQVEGDLVNVDTQGPSGEVEADITETDADALRRRSEEDHQLDAAFGEEAGANLVNLLRDEAAGPSVDDAVDAYLERNPPVFDSTIKAATDAADRETARMSGLDRSTPARAGQYDRAGIISAVDRVGSTLGGIAKDVGGDVLSAVTPSKDTRSYLSNLVGVGDNVTAEGGPNDATEIGAAAKETGTTPTVGESTANSPTTQGVIDKTPAPANNSAAAGVAGSLVANQKQGKPPPEEVYKAMMMAKVGLITMEDVMRFKQTGQLSEPAEATMMNVGNGTIAVYDKAGNLLRSDNFGGGDEIDVGRRKKIYDFVLQQTESEFLYKGEVDEAAQGQFMNALEEIYGLFGIGQEDGRRTNDKFLNQAARGARFVQRFDEDDIQGPLDGGNRWRNIDVTFGDMKVPFTAGNVALGTVFAETGIVRQQDAAFAFKEYIKRLQPGAGFSDAELLDSVQRNEPTIREQWRKSISTGSYTLPSGRVINEKHPLERVREEVVRDLLETHAK